MVNRKEGVIRVKIRGRNDENVNKLNIEKAQIYNGKKDRSAKK